MKPITIYLLSLAGSLTALLLVIGAGAVAFLAWWSRPLGEPMDLDFGAVAALQPDYQLYWGLVLAGVALPFLVEFGLIAYHLGRLANAKTPANAA